MATVEAEVQQPVVITMLDDASSLDLNHVEVVNEVDQVEDHNDDEVIHETTVNVTSSRAASPTQQVDFLKNQVFFGRDF